MGTAKTWLLSSSSGEGESGQTQPREQWVNRSTSPPPYETTRTHTHTPTHTHTNHNTQHHNTPTHTLTPTLTHTPTRNSPLLFQCLSFVGPGGRDYLSAN